MAKTTSAVAPLVVMFSMEKETKNTVKFIEDGEPFTHKVGALYVQKSALADLRNEAGGWPKHIAISIATI